MLAGVSHSDAPPKGLQEAKSTTWARSGDVGHRRSERSHTFPAADKLGRVTVLAKLIYSAPSIFVGAFPVLFVGQGLALYEAEGARLGTLLLGTTLALALSVVWYLLMAVWSDHPHPDQRRRRPFIIAGSLGFIVCVMMLSTPAANTPSGYGVWFVLLFLLASAFDAVTHIPYLALAGELTPDPFHRNEVYMWRNMFDLFGLWLVTVVPLFVQSGGSSIQASVLGTVVAMCIVYAVAQGAVVAFLPERVPNDDHHVASVHAVPALHRVFNNRAMRPVIAAWLLDWLSMMSVVMTLPHFVRFVIQPSSTNAAAATASCFVSFLTFAILGVPLWSLALHHWGHHVVWIASSVINGLSVFLFVLVPEGSFAGAVVVCMFAGLSGGAHFLGELAIADVVDYDEFLNGNRIEACFAIVTALWPKIGAALASIGPLAIVAAGAHSEGLSIFSVGTADESPSRALSITTRLVFVLVPALASLFSALIKQHSPIPRTKSLREIQDGILLHDQGRPSHDPITGVLDVGLPKWYSAKASTGDSVARHPDDEQASLFDHFSADSLYTFVQTARASTGVPEGLRYEAHTQAVGGVFALVACALTAGLLGSALDEWSLQWLPRFAILGVGLSLLLLAIAYYKHQAATAIARKSLPFGMIEEIVFLKQRGQRGGHCVHSLDSTLHRRVRTQSRHPPSRP